MRRFRANHRALAEIVGTLMLVLIVVVAVTAFSLFVAGYQAQLQAEQAQAHQRSLEDIRILSVSTVLNNTTLNASYSRLSFVAGSLDVNTMTVNELLINSQFINYYTVTPLENGNLQQVCPLCNVTYYPGTVKEFTLTSLEQVTITVNLTLQNSSDPTGGFLNPYTLATAGPTDYISISLFTTYGNDFTRTFAAPTAIALTEPSEIFTNGNDTPVVVFDGSESLVPTNDTIVSWSWTITNESNLSWTLQLEGEKALLLQSDFASHDSYAVVLTVISAAGLAGTAKLLYVAR